MKLAAFAIALLLFASFGCSSDDDSPSSSTPSIVTATSPAPTSAAATTPLVPTTLTIEFRGSQGPKELTVEVVDTPEERRTGLRNRQSMPENSGMLFVWPGESTSSFGMPETYIPLTVAFVGEDGTVIHFEDMEPLSTTSHGSPEPYYYAIEANQGWFERNGIAVGDQVTIPEGVADEAR